MNQEPNNPSTTFACPSGLKLIGITPALWIESPKTGKRITIVNGWWNELPARLAARIVRAASVGVRVVTFSREELAAVKGLADRIAAKCRPQPLHGGWHRKTSRSFSAGGARMLRRK